MRNVLIVLCLLWLSLSQSVYALDLYDYLNIGITPIPCKMAGGLNIPVCPSDPQDFEEFYKDPSTGYNKYKKTLAPNGDLSKNFDTQDEHCATGFAPQDNKEGVFFTENPQLLHYWVEDKDITALGKSLERGRQFLHWTMTRQAIDQAPVLREIWKQMRDIALILVLLVSTVFSIGIIIAHRVGVQYTLSIGTATKKIITTVLMIIFSATFIFFLIQLSEILMRFFIETLGSGNLLNTFFGSASSEANYTTFIGCRDLNIRVYEAATTQIFLTKLTYVLYYALGLMILLRKILLWFLLFASPFLPLLLAFPLVRNTGKIWIGVFFQWLMYGPLVALFLGATARIWQFGIPFIFDFSRINKNIGYVFPTSIILTYGGPAQAGQSLLGPLNNGNYIDTFMEYIISLIMLFAVILFPWWLLRIYRDYCCEGIFAAAGYLKELYEATTHHSPSGRPVPNRTIIQKTLNTTQTTRHVQDNTHTSATSSQDIVVMKTADIAQSVGVHTQTLRDIARLETNATSRNRASQNVALLRNPLQATTDTQKQQFASIKSELFHRATTQSDGYARSILNAVNNTSAEHVAAREHMLQDISRVVQSVQTKDEVATTKISQQYDTKEYLRSLASSAAKLANIAQRAGTTNTQTKTVIKQYIQHYTEPISATIDTIALTSRIDKQQVTKIINTAQTQSTHFQQNHFAKLLDNPQFVYQVAKKSGVSVANVYPTIQEFITTGGPSVPETPFIEKVQNTAKKLSIAEAEIQKILDSASTVSEESYISASIRSIVQAMQTSATAIARIADVTHTSHEVVKNVLLSYISHLTSPISQLVSEIGSDVGAPQDVVENILNTVKQMAHQSEILYSIQKSGKMTAGKQQDMLQQIGKVLVQDEDMVASIAEKTQASRKQVATAITHLNDKPEAIVTNTGLSQEKIAAVTKAVSDAVTTSTTIMQGVSGPESIEHITQHIDAHVDKGSDIDETISLPEDQSIDEYEEVRDMWVTQYEEGEVPVSDSVVDRASWVTQDLISHTNILNKLMSKDESLRQQGLDEVGFILPVFLMNNFTGTQLITYLKAKTSAAKQVSRQLAKETTPSSDIQEELIDRSEQTKEENVKHMEIDEKTGEVQDQITKS